MEVKPGPSLRESIEAVRDAMNEDWSVGRRAALLAVCAAAERCAVAEDAFATINARVIEMTERCAEVEEKFRAAEAKRLRLRKYLRMTQSARERALLADRDAALRTLAERIVQIAREANEPITREFALNWLQGSGDSDTREQQIRRGTPGALDALAPAAERQRIANRIRQACDQIEHGTHAEEALFQLRWLADALATADAALRALEETDAVCAERDAAQRVLAGIPARELLYRMRENCFQPRDGREVVEVPFNLFDDIAASLRELEGASGEGK